MQSDHRANLDAEARVVGEMLALAWAHFHLLRGLDNGRLKHPQLVADMPLLYDRMWRAAFDAFFSKVGALLDSKRGTHSLLNFLTQARRYGGTETKGFLPAIEVHLSDESTALAKLKRWRHEAVAHRPAGHDAAAFHTSNKMTLTEVEHALEQLDEYFNQISWNLLGVHSEHRSAFERIVPEAESLFAAASRGALAE